MATTRDRERLERARERLNVFVPEDPTLRERAVGWRYAAMTTNPPPGYADRFTKWIVISRAAVIPMTLVSGLIAGLIGIREPGFSWPLFLLAFLGIALAHVANNVMNDLFDTEVGQDTATYPRAQYAPHPILSGVVSRTQLALIALAVNLADLAIMVLLVIARGPWVLAFAVGGFLLSFAYTAPPLRLKKRGLGELDVLVTWGPLMVAGTYFSATGHLPWQVWVASLPYSLLCTAVLMAKHTDKIPYDEPLAIKTVPVLLGRERALLVTRGLIVGYYVLLVAAVAAQSLPWPALLGLATIPTARKVLPALSRPAPAERPEGFPVWPLWYAAWTFVHTRNAGGMLVLGIALATIFNVQAF